MFKMKQGQLKFLASWAIMWTQNVLGRLAAALGSRPSKKPGLCGWHFSPAFTALLPGGLAGVAHSLALPSRHSAHTAQTRGCSALSPPSLGTALVVFHLNNSLSQSIWHQGASASYFFQQMSFSFFFFPPVN